MEGRPGGAILRMMLPTLEAGGNVRRAAAHIIPREGVGAGDGIRTHASLLGKQTLCVGCVGGVWRAVAVERGGRPDLVDRSIDRP